MSAELFHVLRDQPRIRLRDVRPHAGPGAYAHVLGVGTDRTEVIDTFSPLLARGRYPVYVGQAQCLRERQGRYRQGLCSIPAFGEDDVWVALLPCSSTASAAFAEAALVDTLDPLGNRLGGWGSRWPGPNRTEQKSSPLDALFPGRGWVRPAEPRDRLRALATVVGYLAELDPAGPRWPALPAG